METSRTTTIKAQPRGKASHVRSYHHGNLKETLLSTAERGLEKGGLGKITLRDLSRELGVSHASPRRHFADKQALLDALAERGFLRLAEFMTRAAKGDGDFPTRLVRLARAYAGFALRSPALFALMHEAKHRPGAPRELVEASEKTFIDTVQVFAEGQTAGEVVAGDPVRLSLGTMAAVQGLLSIATNGRIKGAHILSLIPEVITNIMLGLSPRSRR